MDTDLKSNLFLFGAVTGLISALDPSFPTSVGGGSFISMGSTILLHQKFLTYKILKGDYIILDEPPKLGEKQKEVAGSFDPLQQPA